MGGWVHIVLVGASIVANARRSGLIDYDIPELEKRLRVEDMRDKLIKILLDYVGDDYRRASAELNTCMDLIIQGYENGRQQWCYLLSSDTEVGKLCGDALARFLKKFSSEKLNGMLAVLDPAPIPFLGDPEKFNDGLANLFEKIIEIISYHKKIGDNVFVHATGGFKPETAIAILAANMPMTGAPTFYVHEHFNQLVRIPAIPITFRRWKKFSDMMNSLMSIDRANKQQYVKIFSKRTVEEAIRLGWIEEGMDGSIKPTAFGKLLWKKIRG